MSAIPTLGYLAQTPRLEEEKKFGQKVKEAAAEPIKDLKESFRFWHSVGSMFVCLARPKRVVSQFFSSCLRKGWEKAGVDSAIQSTVAKSCNAVKWMTGDVNWVTRKDVADWQVPTPSPAMLRNMKRGLERAGVPSMIGTAGKTTFRLTNGAYHKLYGENLVDLPDVSPEIINLLFGTRSHLPFSERVDEFFLQSLPLNPIINEAGERGWAANYPLLNIAGCVRNDIAHIKNELSNAVKEAVQETLNETKAERRALVEALEGVALSFLYKKVAELLPGKETFIREIVLYAIQNYFNPLGALNHFFPEHLQKAIDSMPKEPLELAKTVANLDFVDSAATKLGQAVEAASFTAAGGNLVGEPLEGAVAALSSMGGKVAKQAFTHGATIGLEYGPATGVLLYKIIYQELEKLAAKGNQRIENFSFLNLIWGISSESKEMKPVDPNDDYFAPIASEFVLGTLNRLCEKNGLLAVLYEAFEEMRKPKPSSAPSKPLAGVEELKTALVQFVATLQAKLKDKLKTKTQIVFQKESFRQAANVNQVREAIAANEETLHRKNAQLIANIIGANPETVHSILTFNPLTLFYR